MTIAKPATSRKTSTAAAAAAARPRRGKAPARQRSPEEAKAVRLVARGLRAVVNHKPSLSVARDLTLPEMRDLVKKKALQARVWTKHAAELVQRDGAAKEELEEAKKSMDKVHEWASDAKVCWLNMEDHESDVNEAMHKACFPEGEEGANELFEVSEALTGYTGQLNGYLVAARWLSWALDSRARGKVMHESPCVFRSACVCPALLCLGDLPSKVYEARAGGDEAATRAAVKALLRIA